MTQSRYAKQLLFHHWNEDRQRALGESRVFLCGCGALGTVIADSLARAGVGFLRIVDRDFVETSNLQRQILFDEADVVSGMPKAVAAADKLRRINSEITIEPVVADVDYGNVRDFAGDVDLIVDGTDNFEIRFLLNDVALELATPWIYAGVVGSHGQTMTILPGETACLRCLVTDVPEAGAAETCDTAGVLGPAVNVIASLEVVSALKILGGLRDQIDPVLTVVDVWDGTFRRMNLGNLRDSANCPACQGGERKWLDGHEGSKATILCGRNAVQVSPPRRGELALEDLAKRLAEVGPVRSNAYLLKLTLTDPDREITVFRDGRAIVKGTEDESAARALYSRYVGS